MADIAQQLAEGKVPVVRCTRCAEVKVWPLIHQCPPSRDDQGRVQREVFYLADGTPVEADRG